MRDAETVEFRWVYVTVANRVEARAIARTVVEERLAACANVLGDIESFYWWDGAVETGDEVALVLKTVESKMGLLIERIEALHSYECPCVVGLPIEAGSAGFMKWITTETDAK